MGWTPWSLPTAVRCLLFVGGCYCCLLVCGLEDLGGGGRGGVW
jgi:hypothetical protein